jgi:hypothetical protein
MKNKKLFVLFSVIIFAVGIVMFINMNDKNEETKKVYNTGSSQSQSVDAFSKSSVIDHTDVTETSYSYEAVTMSMDELATYREKIEQAGVDSTLFTDQDIQAMAAEIEKSGQSLSDYLKKQDIEKIDDAEIENARKALRAADINPDKMHNNEIIELIKQAKKEKKSVVEVAKEK